MGVKFECGYQLHVGWYSVQSQTHMLSFDAAMYITICVSETLKAFPSFQ